MGATLPIPPGKGIVQPLGGGRAARSLSPLSLPGSGADSPPHSVSPAWSKEVSLGGISGGFKAASSAPAPGRRHQRRSLPSAESSQQQICSAPKTQRFPTTIRVHARCAGKRFDRPPRPSQLPGTRTSCCGRWAAAEPVDPRAGQGAKPRRGSSQASHEVDLETLGVAGRVRQASRAVLGRDVLFSP